jgi:hypothetical protein
MGVVLLADALLALLGGDALIEDTVGAD